MLCLVTQGSRTTEAPSAVSCVSSSFVETGTPRTHISALPLLPIGQNRRCSPQLPTFTGAWEAFHREGNTGKSFGIRQFHDENSKPRGWRVWEGEPWREFTRSLEMVI